MRCFEAGSTGFTECIEDRVMKARRKLLPGQPGTKKLLEQYGDDLVCVRYRYDSKRKLKIKTVELIVAQGPWQPRIPGEQIMNVRVDYGERELGKQVKAAGGTWNKQKRAWELAYNKVVALGLTERIIQEKA